MAAMPTEAIVRAVSNDFFVAGGTLGRDTLSYVTRRADAQLFDGLLSGDYCYVLNSRQMGKSSLCIRTIDRLNEAGIQTVFLDLTKLGGRNITADQWYAGMLNEIGRALDLRFEFLQYWNEHSVIP